MSKKRTTNTEFIKELMEFSPSGPMMQAFVLEAINNYAVQVQTMPPWNNGFISHEVWKSCADEVLETLKDRGLS
jgi:hypothetical protein